MVRSVGGLLLLVVLALGCFKPVPRHPSAAPKPVAQFPNPAALAAVEAKTVELPSLQTGVVPDEGWTVDPGDVAASPADVWAPRGPWEEALAQTFAASGRKAALTRSMACVAGELGRFYLHHHAAPPEALQRFVSAACGVFAARVGYQWLAGALADRVSDERALDTWREQLGRDLLDHLPPGARRIGLWAGRHQGHAVALAAYDATPVELKPFSVVPDAHGDVVIEGRLEGSAEHFAGYANQGRFGVANCRVDAGVPRPAFRITCPVAPGDDTAWLEIAYAPPRSVLVLPLVEVLARRDATKPLTFSEAPHASSHPVASGAEFAPAALAGLNAARAEAGLSPVRAADAESATAARVARQYFAATLTQEAPGALDEMSTIALGLLAGWQVTGTIRDGTFFSGVVPNTHDVGRWLDSALRMPIGRHALLARDIEEVAFGPAMFTAPDGLGSVVCGYRFQHGDDHTADAEALLARIGAARQRLSLPVPERLTGVGDVLRRELAYVQRGEQAPVDALNESLHAATRRMGASMRGYIFQATSLDALELPPAILHKPHLQLDVGVTHWKPPGAAWAELVILVL
jgi:hypothetical protein